MIREETRGAARLLTIDRPSRKNALDRETADALAAAIERASADPAVRGVILAATGDVFLAGGDLADFQQLLSDPVGADAVLSMGRRLDAVERCSVPVLAAVSGHVFGGGCELVLACDEAIADPAATLCFRHVRMGLCPAWGATARLVARVGQAHASRLLLTAATVGAVEAARIGLLSEVSAGPGGALAAAEARVSAIAVADRDVIAVNRRLLRSTAAGDAGRSEEEAAFRSLWGGPAHRAAMETFARRSGR